MTLAHHCENCRNDLHGNWLGYRHREHKQISVIRYPNSYRELFAVKMRTPRHHLYQ